LSGRYVFGEFVLSSSRRILLRSGREVPLVPRYLDLLLLLVHRRREAISRREILDTVWSDVVVSDGALSQAVRTLRRALGDDRDRSRYIRTVSRHGYQFVFADVVECDDREPLPRVRPTPSEVAGAWRRYLAGIAGATIAGFVAGLAGGLVLYLGPSSRATAIVVMLLPLVGGVIAATGASGVAAGLCCAEVRIRRWRGPALVLCGAAGGALVGAVAHGVGSMALRGLFGQDLSPVAGGLEGLVLGAATGLGYALATRGGTAAPRGCARWRAALAAGVCCAGAAAMLTATGSYLGAMSLDLLAHRFPGSQVGLEPLARLLGEAGPGPATRIAIGAWEGLMFASGTVLGLTHRPK